MGFSTKTKQHLKARAHKLKPVILIGNLGLTKAVHAEIERALNDHELIKIRFPAAEKPLKKALASEISEFHSALMVQLIGNVGTFYRKQQDKKA